ncbi:MAG: hypothetical protein OXL37_18505 [Chloroflexota bacterium]|nr:hypothetical protein [Chloroflexota bacterium]MDE2958961.1 hypothetical protein [Chloroflexota bacterium]
MKVLIIPEDFRKDQYMLKPIFERLLRSIGDSSPKVRVCQDPLLGGDREALKSERIAEVLSANRGMYDVYVLCVDRDGQTGRRRRLDQIEAEFGTGRVFLAENAWEEIETWVLAGLELPSDWRWAEVRAEVHVKEQYFEPLVAARGFVDSPGGGRRTLGDEASRNISAIRQKCPEDFDALAERLETGIQAA